MNWTQYLSVGEIISFIGLIFVFLTYRRNAVQQFTGRLDSGEKRLAVSEQAIVLMKVQFEGFEKQSLEWRQTLVETTQAYQAAQSANIKSVLSNSTDMIGQFKTTWAQYLELCEKCRDRVLEHHEDTDRHVTPDLRSIITKTADDVQQIHIMVGQLASRRKTDMAIS